MNIIPSPLLRAAAAVILIGGFVAAPCAAKLPVLNKDGGINVSGKRDIRIDADKVRHDNVTVAKGEVMKGDIITSGAILVEGTVEGDCVSLGGSVDVPGEVRGDAVSIGGNIHLGGSTKGDLAAIGGSVRVSGKVSGDVAAIGGDVALDKGAEVGGDVSVVGGHLTKQDGVSIKGSVSQAGLGALKGLLPALTRGGLNLAMVSGGSSRFHSHWRQDDKEDPSEPGHFAGALEHLAFIVGFGLVLCLGTLFLPAETNAVAAAIRQDFWRSVGVGTLIMILLLPGALLLTVSILGIPLIPLAILAWCAAAVLGLAAFSRVVAERAAQSLNKPLPVAPLTVGMGWLILETMPFVGKLIGGFIGGTFTFTGFMLLSFALVAGLGAAWNTRMGRRIL